MSRQPSLKQGLPDLRLPGDDQRDLDQVSRLCSSGSGIVVDPAGYIAPNAYVPGVDKETDHGLLKIDAKDLPNLDLGDSDAVSQGDFVLAIGSPMLLRNSLAMGRVSAPRPCAIQGPESA